MGQHARHGERKLHVSVPLHSISHAVFSLAISYKHCIDVSSDCVEAVKEVNAKRAEKGESMTAEQEDFVEDLLDALMERVINLDATDKENVEINKALFQVGRLSSSEARRKDPKQTHATFTALWPLFEQVNSQVGEEESEEEEETVVRAAKKTSKRQQEREEEEDGEVAIFETLISTLSLILNIRVNAVRSLVQEEGLALY